MSGHWRRSRAGRSDRPGKAGAVSEEGSNCLTPLRTRAYSVRAYSRPPLGEFGMSDLEMTNEGETEEFTDELSDEALDGREQAKLCIWCGN